MLQLFLHSFITFHIFDFSRGNSNKSKMSRRKKELHSNGNKIVVLSILWQDIVSGFISQFMCVEVRLKIVALSSYSSIRVWRKRVYNERTKEEKNQQTNELFVSYARTRSFLHWTFSLIIVISFNIAEKIVIIIIAILTLSVHTLRGVSTFPIICEIVLQRFLSIFWVLKANETQCEQTNAAVEPKEDFNLSAICANTYVQTKRKTKRQTYSAFK